MAIQSGAEIVPAFVFGEKWLYAVKPIPPSIKSFFMRRLRTPLLIFYGRYFSWLPFHDEKKAFLSVVFGAPIPVLQQAEPSDEYINELWAAYSTQIHAIFQTYKGKFGYSEEETLVLKEAKSSKENNNNGASANGGNKEHGNGASNGKAADAKAKNGKEE